MRNSVAVIACALVLAGCGGQAHDNHVASLQSASSSAGSTPSPSSDEDKQVAFARCMRQHGVNVPDPGSANGGKVHISGSDGSTKRALDACRHLLPSGSKLNPTSPQQMDIMVQLARCLRRHGINVPDPTVANPDFQISAEQKTSRAFAAALQACKISKPSSSPGAR